MHEQVVHFRSFDIPLKDEEIPYGAVTKASIGLNCRLQSLYYNRMPISHEQSRCRLSIAR